MKFFLFNTQQEAKHWAVVLKKKTDGTLYIAELDQVKLLARANFRQVTAEEENEWRTCAWGFAEVKLGD